MQSIALRVGGVAAVALLCGTAAVGGGQKQQWHGDGPEHGTPCADGLVSVELVQGCPLDIEVLEASCRPATNTIWVHYAIKNVGTKQVQSYSIRTSERYERFLNDNQGYGAERLEFIPGSQRDDWATCCDRLEVEIGDPGRFTQLVLIVTEVEFADGTVWRAPAKTLAAPK